MRHNKIMGTAGILVLFILVSPFFAVSAQSRRPPARENTNGAGRENRNREQTTVQGPVQAPLPQNRNSPNTGARNGAQRNGGIPNPPGDPGAGRMDDINRAWMNQIHGLAQQSGNGSQTDGASSDSAEHRPEEGSSVQLADPGPSSGRDEGNPESAGSAPNRTSSLFPPDEGPSFVSVVLKFLGLMIVMLGCFYLLIRYMKKKSGQSFGSGGLMKVIATMPVAQGKSVQVVDLAGRLLVLGVAESGVNLIMPVDDAMTADRIRLWHSNSADRVIPAGITDRLGRLLKQTDFKFWHSGRDESPRQDFGRMLEKETGSEPREKSLENGESFSRDADGAVLSELLAAQKRKLAAIKNKERAQQ